MDNRDLIYTLTEKEREEKSKEFFKNNNYEDYKIKDWSKEKGSNLHPLLSEMPVVNLGMLLRDLIIPVQNKIENIIKNKNGEYPEIHKFKTDDGKVTAKEFNISSFDKDLFSYLEDSISKKLSTEDIEVNISDIIVGLYKASKDNLGKKGMHATEWHLDDEGSNVRLIIYLDDINDELDGPFEVCNNSDKNAYKLKKLSEQGIHLEDRIVPEAFPSEEEDGKKFFGPKYSTIMFYSSIPHRANRPIRKDRPFLFVLLNVNKR
jgi:hypothetical protein